MNRDDIVNKRFSHSLFGYNRAEVDEFIDEITCELDDLAQRLENAQRELDEKEAELAKNAERLKILAREIKKYRE